MSSMIVVWGYHYCDIPWFSLSKKNEILMQVITIIVSIDVILHSMTTYLSVVTSYPHTKLLLPCQHGRHIPIYIYIYDDECKLSCCWTAGYKL